MENKVQSRDIDYSSLVRRQWGKEYKKPDTAYEFSNGRKFEDTTEQGGSFYQPGSFQGYYMDSGYLISQWDYVV
jgi:hypothetical protein